MANITRYDPFPELTGFRPFRDVEDLLSGFLVKPVLREAPPTIKVDVSEDDKAYTVRAEIPGVKKEDISISVDNGEVSISAEVKKIEEEKEGKKVIRSERYYGRVFRRFALEHDVDSTTANAKYSDGVLELTLPKKQRATSTGIKVS